jgi:hypothetical protein
MYDVLSAAQHRFKKTNPENRNGDSKNKKCLRKQIISEFERRGSFQMPFLVDPTSN